MDWGRSQSIGSRSDFNPLGPGAGAEGRQEQIELVGPYLRVRGDISLLRFSRLSDMLNHGRGFVRVFNATLLRRNGEPTNLVIPELMVNQDEITFIGQRPEAVTESTGLPGGMDRPLMERVPRQLVVFTSGHTLTGSIHLFSETDIATFVDSPDPHFVAMVDVTARSLADLRVTSTFGLVLINRNQITAASLLEMSGGAGETGVSIE
jgi:Family of unknown function (DUF6812)